MSLNGSASETIKGVLSDSNDRDADSNDRELRCVALLLRGNDKYGVVVGVLGIAANVLFKVATDAPLKVATDALLGVLAGGVSTSGRAS